MPKKDGTESISVSLEIFLVEILDYLVGRRDISRSAAVKEAVKLWCANEVTKSPEFWARASYGVRNRAETKGIV